jgi:hypothetical protein
VAPARAKRSEIAWPMPRVPPVITNDLPDKENGSFPVALMRRQFPFSSSTPLGYQMAQLDCGAVRNQYATTRAHDWQAAVSPIDLNGTGLFRSHVAIPAFGRYARSLSWYRIA